MTLPTTTNRNGNGDGDLPHSGAVLSWKPGRGGEAKELLSVEKDRGLNFEFPEVALKTVLDSNDEAIDFTQAIHHCMEFHMKDMLSEIYTLLAFKPAVGGLARHQFLEALTGVMWDPKARKPVFGTTYGDRDKKERKE